MNITVSLLVESALKGTAILAFATILVIVLRNSSASRKYAVWSSALMGMLLLPFITALLPRIQVVPRVGLPGESPQSHVAEAQPSPADVLSPAPGDTANPESAFAASSVTHTTARAADNPNRTVRSAISRERTEGTAAGASAEPVAIQASPGDRIPSTLAVIWLAGFSLAILPILIGYIGVRRLTRRSTAIERGPIFDFLMEAKRTLGVQVPVRLLLGPPGAMPMTWGIGLEKPATILLSAEANEWSEDRLRRVLLHELAHIRRHDCLTQSLGRLACSVYWFHPWVWVALARMLIERERACDDIVLRHSTSPSTYARDLVDIASRTDTTLPAARAAIAMARPNKFDTRLRAILDPRRNRNGLSKRLLMGLVLFTALISLPVASLQWAATPPPEEPSTATESQFERAMDFRLIDANTGRPVGNADVQATNPPGLRTVATEEEGHWVIELPEDRSYFIIKVYADDYAPVWLLWNNLQLQDPLPESHTLPLERGRPMGGMVVDDTGAPVAGATVALWFDRERAGRARLIDPSIETGEDGRWEYPVVPEDIKDVTIGAHHPDYASHHPSASSYLMYSYEPISDLRDGTATYVLKRGEPLEGIVVDPVGVPMEGVGVGIGPNRTIHNRVPEFVTDADGRFRLRVHPDEEVVLFVNHPGYAPEVARFHSGERPDEVRIQLSPGRTLTGQVVNSAGPIADATVVMWEWRDTRSLNHRMRTDEEGRFEWNEAPEDTVLASAHVSGYTTKRDIPVRAGQENLIHITSEPTVRGTVVDAETGEPVRHFNLATPGNWFVSAEPPEPINWEVKPEHRFDSEDGSFEFTVSGDFHLWTARVEVEGYGLAHSETFAVDAGDQVLTFELERADWVTAHVSDNAGRAATGARVFLAPRGASLSFENGDLEIDRRNILKETTDSNGRFSFPPQQGPFLLVVFHETGYAELTAEEVPESGEVILRPWARLQGEAWVRGEPASNYEISSRYSQPATADRPYLTYMVTTSADAEGHFVFDRIPAGEVHVTRIVRDRTTPFISRNAHQKSTTAHLEAGETERVVIGGTGRPVTGRVSLEHLEGIEWVAPTARVTKPEEPTGGSDSFRHDFVLRADGSFRIEDLDPGDYSINIAFREAPPSGRYRSLANVVHTFTVQEFEGPHNDDPIELPLLGMERID